MSPGSRNRTALAAVFLAFALTHGLYQTGRAFFHPKQGLDFTPEYVAARMLVDHDGQRFYDYDAVKEYGRRLGLHGPLGPGDPVVNYAYPPWLPLFYVPVSRLPWNVARQVWFALSMLAVFGAAALAGAAVAPSAKARRPFATGAVAASCFFFPIFYGLMDGQANDLPLLGIAACLYLLRTDRPFLAGLVLAPAGMWKIMTGFPALLLIARREWRALGGLALGCVALVLVSLPFVGVQTWLDWATYIRGHNVLAGPALRNHSIASSVLLLFQPSPIAPPLADAPWLVRPLTLALEGLAIAATALALFPAARRDEPRYAVQFGATLVLAVLLTPRAWEHYGIYLFPAFFACFAAAAASLGEERPRLAALALLGAAFATWGFFFQVKEEYYALATRARVIFIPAKMYAAFALLGLCAWLSLARGAAPAADGAAKGP